MIADDIPQWALERAAAMMNEGQGTEEHRCTFWTPERVLTFGYSAPFARYIAAHEEPPVDPLLIEAREIVKATLTPDSHKRCNCRAEIDAGQWDNGQKVRASLAALRRGIELAKSQ